MFIHSQIKRNHYRVFAPSLRRVAFEEQKKKERLKITAVVMYAWYLGACGYCSEAWIFRNNKISLPPLPSKNTPHILYSCSVSQSTT